MQQHIWTLIMQLRLGNTYSTEDVKDTYDNTGLSRVDDKEGDSKERKAQRSSKLDKNNFI